MPALDIISIIIIIVFGSYIIYHIYDSYFGRRFNNC